MPYKPESPIADIGFGLPTKDVELASEADPRGEPQTARQWAHHGPGVGVRVVALDGHQDLITVLPSHGIEEPEGQGGEKVNYSTQLLIMILNFVLEFHECQIHWKWDNKSNVW